MADAFDDLDAAAAAAAAAPQAASAPASSAPLTIHGSDAFADLDAAAAEPAASASAGSSPTGSSLGTIAEAPFVGFNRGLADVLGAPVDAINWVAGKAGLPVSQTPFGGSDSIKRGLGLIGANPDDHQANSTVEKYLQAGGAGAASMIAPEAAVGALGRAGALAPKVADLAKGAFGSAESLPAVAVNAASGAGAGLGAQAGEDVAPDRYKPAAAMVGSLIGGGLPALGSAGIAAGARKGMDAYHDYVRPMSAEGQQQIAGGALRDAASDPVAVADALDTMKPLVPGSTPTLFQQTGDMGLGSLERTQAAQSPELYQQRRADQNAARLDALTSVQPTGDPTALSSFFAKQLGQVDDFYGTLESAAQRRAQGAAAALPGTDSPEAIGSALRGNIADARQAVKERETALWNAVDPDGTLANTTAPIKAAADQVYGNLPKADAANLSGPEQTMLGLVKGYSPVEPFREVASLRSNLAQAMRDELTANGKSPAYARMSGLMDGVQGVINNTIEGQAAQEAHAVSTGAMAPEDTIAARLNQDIAGARPAQDPEAGRATGTADSSGAGLGTPDDLGQPGAQVSPGRLPGNASGGEGLPQDAGRASATAFSPQDGLALAEQAAHAAHVADVHARFPSVFETFDTLTPETVQERRSAAVAQEKADYANAYGEDGEDARNLANRLSRTSSDSTYASLQAKLDALAQKHGLADDSSAMARLEGRGYPDEATPDFWRDVQTKLGDVSNAQELGTLPAQLREDLRRLPKSSDPAEMTPDQKVAMVGANASLKLLTESGLTEREALERAYGAGKARDGNDAAELFQADLERYRDLRGDPSAASAPPVAPPRPSPRALAPPEPSADPRFTAPAVDPSAMTRAPQHPGVPRPQNLHSFVRSLGGVQDPGGDLASMGLHSIIAKPGKGLGPDAMRQVAAEAGYLGGDKTAAMADTTINDLHNALEVGDRRYSVHDEDALHAWDQYDDGRAAWQRQRAESDGRSSPAGPRPKAPLSSYTPDDIYPPGMAPAPAGTPEPANGALTPNYDAAAAARLKEASAATKARAETFDQGVIGGVLRTQGTAGNYRTMDAKLPGIIFAPGPAGKQVADAYFKAVGQTPQAMSDFVDAAALSLRKAAVKDGMVDPGKLEAWKARHADALRAAPAAAKQFDNAATATKTYADLAAARRAAVDTFQAGAIGRVMGQGDPVKGIGAILARPDAAAQMRTLAARAAADPAAAQGLRKAVVDHMLGRLVSNTEAATSGKNLLKSDQFQTFVRQNRAALKPVFSDPELGLMQAVADDLHRANRSITAVKLPGQSNTAQDLTALAAKEPGPKASLLTKVLAAAAPGLATGNPLTMIGGAGSAVGQHILGGMRDAGMRKAGDLVRDAMLDPELARALLAKAPVAANRGSEITLRQQLGRLAVFSGAAGAMAQ